MVFLEPSGSRLYFRAAELFRDLLARDRDMDAILDSGLLKVARWPPPVC